MARREDAGGGTHLDLPEVKFDASDRSFAAFLDTILKFYLATLEWAENNPILFVATLLLLGWWLYTLRLKARDKLEMTREVGEQKGESGHSGGSEIKIPPPDDSGVKPSLPSPAEIPESNRIAPPRRHNEEDGHD